MNMYSLIKYSHNYSQTSGRVWLQYRHEPALDNNENIIDFTVNDGISLSFKFKKI